MALTKLRPAGQGFVNGPRNLIINGAMQLAQRGTSSTGASYKTVDRFFYSSSNLDNHAFTQTQQAVTDLAGFTNSWRITTTTAESAIAADELVYVAQKIEAQNLQQLAYGTSSAKRVTLSFYVKSSVTGTFSTNLYQADDARVVNSEYTISSANTWERKEITYVADQTGVIDNNNGTGFYVTWNLALGSSWKGNAATAWEAYNTDNWARAGTYTDAVITTVNSTWEITGVQLEVGSNASDFEHRRFDDEWNSCQRYCTVYNLGGGNTHPQNFIKNNHSVPGAAGHVDVANRAEWFMSYPVKRAEPTITVTDPTNMRWIGSGNLVKDATGSVTFPVGTSYQSANVFQSCASTWATSVVPEGWVYKSSGTNPSITIDAELQNEHYFSTKVIRNKERKSYRR